jgi:hypothetical protein
VHSSTSNFERLIPRGPWQFFAIGALLILIVSAVALEWRLASLGHVPTVTDSGSRWRAERLRANRLGARALVLVGASRIQLGVDMTALREATPLEPVQLAIDGSSFLPVLRGLAEDERFLGTVIVDYYDHILVTPPGFDAAERYQRQFSTAHLRAASDDWEEALTHQVRDRFRVYADGGRPWDALTRRAWNTNAMSQYLTTFPDRSRSADHRLVPLPAFYHALVIGMLKKETGQEVAVSSDAADLERRLQAGIANAAPADEGAFLRQAVLVRSYVDAIKRRGGRVYFVSMPTSGMVRELTERRYPAALFRQRFAALMNQPVIDTNTVFGPNAFVCPDGSHLDAADRGRFSNALAQQLGLAAR